MISIKTDSLTNWRVNMRSHKLNDSVFRITCAEHHSFRHDPCKLSWLQVGEYDDFIGQHRLEIHIRLQTRYNSSQSSVSFAQINLFDKKFLWLRMRFALNNSTNTNIALGKNIEFLGQATCSLGWSSRSFWLFGSFLFLCRLFLRLLFLLLLGLFLSGLGGCWLVLGSDSMLLVKLRKWRDW